MKDSQNKFDISYKNITELKPYKNNSRTHTAKQVHQIAKSDKYDRIIEASKIYDDYKNKFYEYMKSVEGKEIIELFDEIFPNNTISNVKKIDFILWQDRKQKDR